jgi:hypothetical protein
LQAGEGLPSFRRAMRGQEERAGPCVSRHRR